MRKLIITLLVLGLLALVTAAPAFAFPPGPPPDCRETPGAKCKPLQLPAPPDPPDPCPPAGCNTSDRNVKENFAPVDGRDILERLSTIPIEAWNYKNQDPSVRHIGPMAQDFYAAFGVGADDKYIATVDADGMALAAIQRLYQIVQEKDVQIAELEARLALLEQRLGGEDAGTTSSGSGLPSPWFLLVGLPLGGLVLARRWQRR